MKTTKLFIGIFLCISILFSSCADSESSVTVEKKDLGNAPLFVSLPGSKTKIDFRNDVVENKTFNFVKYLNAYNGGGVAIGDLDNDGLDDIYFSSNQNENKLYRNKGGLTFENITSKAGVKSKTGWTTGVSMVDINADGLLDIYVCKSGSLNDNDTRRNELYINKGNLTFVNEAAKYGLDAFGFFYTIVFFRLR